MKNIRTGIEKYNEPGVISKTGPAFHSPSDFAVKNLFYAVWCDQFCCNRSYQVTHEYLENFSLIVVLHGEMEFRYEDETLFVGKNEAILLDFRRRHSYRSLTDDLVKWELIFNGAASEAYYNLLEHQWGIKLHIDSRLSAVVNMLKSEMEEVFPQDHKISYLIQLMFAAIIDQHQGHMSPEVEKAIQYMYSNYGESLMIGEIAEHVSLSRSYFTKLFSRETGYSPSQYLMNIRINMAQEMLLGRVLSVSQIAEECGFGTVAHFSRVFKAKIGESPRAFRNSFGGSQL